VNPKSLFKLNLNKAFENDYLWNQQLVQVLPKPISALTSTGDTTFFYQAMHWTGKRLPEVPTLTELFYSNELESLEPW